MSTTVVVCPNCLSKNRIPLERLNHSAKCGRCHAPLPAAQPDGQSMMTLRCSQCKAKNRVPAAKLHSGAKCGRCGAPLQHEDLTSGRPVVVSDANFAQTVLQSPLPCGVCSGTGPMVEQLASETRGKIRVGKLNIDANPGLASKYNIMSVPAFFIFDAGQVKEYLPGAVPKHELMLKMGPYLS